MSAPSHESSLEQTNAQLAEANARISRLIRTVAHELRNPLASIATEAYLFRSAKSRSERDEAAEALQEAAARLLRLTTELLDYSRIEAGVDQPVFEPFQPARLVETVARSFRPEAQKQGLVLEWYVDDGPDTVCGDAQRVDQILVNLVGNALKFTDAGSVCVRLATEGENWLILVADDGIGIPRREQNLIFEEFASVDSLDHQARRGTGLGLAICRRLCHMMGGEISVRSRKAKGSTFTVTLPRDLNGGSRERTPDEPNTDC